MGCHADEPLGLDARLDDVVAPVAAPDHHLVRLRRDEVALRLEVAQDALARLLRREARVGSRALVHAPVVGHDVDERQVVPAAGREVVVVVGRGDLDGARAEALLHHAVGDDGHDAVHERDEHASSDEALVARVVGMDRHGRVAEDASPDASWRR